MNYSHCMSTCENIAKDKNKVNKALGLYVKHCTEDLRDAYLPPFKFITFLNYRDGWLTVGMEAETITGLKDFLVVKINVEATEKEFEAEKTADGKQVWECINLAGGAWWAKL